MTLHIHLFACLQDNYGFLLYDDESAVCASIDTPDGALIAKTTKQLGWPLTHIFNTHHHDDHVGGNIWLQKNYGVHIIGPQADKARIPGINTAYKDGDIFNFGAHKIHVLDTPGHTKGHCAYYVPDCESVFVGDTLFALGCGRLFEGTPKDMFDSLAKLATLPHATKIYAAHEYTLANGAFALSIDGDNPDLQNYVQNARNQRAQGKATIPTMMGLEKQVNPFMRAKNAAELGVIRRAKDAFKA